MLWCGCHSSHLVVYANSKNIRKQSGSVEFAIDMNHSVALRYLKHELMNNFIAPVVMQKDHSNEMYYTIPSIRNVNDEKPPSSE